MRNSDVCNLLIHKSGTMIEKLAHIHAAEKVGARFDGVRPMLRLTPIVVKMKHLKALFSANKLVRDQNTPRLVLA